MRPVQSQVSIWAQTTISQNPSAPESWCHASGQLCEDTAGRLLSSAFINNPRSILTREQLLDELWDAAGEFVNDNTLTVYIKRLREKIEEDSSCPRIILTVRGTGYRLGGSDVQK